MQSATPTDSKKRKLNLPSLRAAAPSRKAVKRLAVALPAIAVIGAVVASQIHPGKDDPARSAAFQVQSNHVAKSTRAGKPQPKGAHATRVAPKWTRSVSAHNVEVTHARKVHVRRPRPICAGRSGMLPANFGKIVAFLTAHGYTKMAAAGIAGNIYQESKGNPESVGTGGGGLIGWTPLPAGFV
ncbi:MAG TPA: phage tail tip lysozyme, partial [Streptosporangiaceae bacterium]|nr:phage tail tip lysozyme [Streptosporangiaceae bacterium]